MPEQTDPTLIADGRTPSRPPVADLPPVACKLAVVGKPNVAQISSGPTKTPLVCFGIRNQTLEPSRILPGLLILAVRLLSASIGTLFDYFIVDVYHCCPVPVCRDHKVFEYRVLLVLIEPTLDTNEL